MRDKVSVNTLYTRSVNLERDIVSTEGIRSYIVTDNALQLLQRFHETHKKPGSPKAWCVVSPYGTGKSSFAVFLSCLLRAFQGNEHREAIKKLGQSDGKLAAAFKRTAANPGTAWFCSREALNRLPTGWSIALNAPLKSTGRAQGEKGPMCWRNCPALPARRKSK